MRPLSGEHRRCTFARLSFRNKKNLDGNLVKICDYPLHHRFSGRILSDYPFFRLDEIENAHAGHSERKANVGDIGPVRVSGWLLVRH